MTLMFTTHCKDNLKGDELFALQTQTILFLHKRNKHFINMTYTQALEYLFNQLPAYHRIGKAAYKANLDNAKALDEYFGHPHKKFRSVHVAGTNGKGSVSHNIASVFQEAGYKTGLYTSPHLRDFRERIRVNGTMIPEDEVVYFVEKHSGIIEHLKPSFFELTMAMAFDFFARSGVEVAVIEVGMGGRLDSTNIIDPELSVITNIGHDHMDFLGKTLSAIAGEKAGIIKKNRVVVIGETQAETEKVFLEKAREMDAPVVFADKAFLCTLGNYNYNTGLSEYCIEKMNCKSVISGETPLGGIYQEKNLQTVFAATEIIKLLFNVSDQNITDGIRKVVMNTHLAGRWQILSDNPLTICDTGHNKEGLEYVVRQLIDLRKKRMHIILGFVNDKDLTAVLPMFPAYALYYFTKASIPRALDENILKAEALKTGLTGNSYATVKEALNEAGKNAAIDDVIFIGGSTFIVAEVV
jgi:dihydrofolate synthase / folylpolyglutamate synthase